MNGVDKAGDIVIIGFIISVVYHRFL